MVTLPHRSIRLHQVPELKASTSPRGSSHPFADWMIEEAVAYIVDDDSAIRESIDLLLKPWKIQTRTYPSAAPFLKEYTPNAAECLIADVRMPGISGLELQERLRRRGYTIPVIMVTAHADVPMAVRAMKAGALDFIEKPWNASRLLQRIRDALEMAAEAYDRRLRQETMTARMTLLSDREREVLRRVVSGRYNKVIAAELRVSVSTVEAHRRNIMRKLRANSLYELVRIADSHWDRRRR